MKYKVCMTRKYEVTAFIDADTPEEAIQNIVQGQNLKYENYIILADYDRPDSIRIYNEDAEDDGNFLANW